MATEAPHPDTLACVDLGSNSFHLIVAREVEGQPHVLDRLRERVALAEGLKDGALDPEVAARALDCLARFGQRAAGIDLGRVRAVGTATFRRIRGGSRFLESAEAALGHPIEILPGREEARLIYLGVAHTLGDDEGRRLVVDIGGGSTECVLGERFESDAEESLSMGCITWSRRFFGKGKLTRKAFDKAEFEAARQLEPVQAELERRGWEQSIGASGTILAVSRVLEQEGWSDGTITTEGLDAMRSALIECGHVDALDLAGLRSDRKGVIAGGLAILRAVFDTLDIERMRTSPGSLREGLMYDLMGRIHHEDVRTRAVQAFGSRLAVDEAQATRVLQMARHLFEGARAAWKLTDEDGDVLAWAAWLHAVGHVVSYSGYPKHGAYLIENADLPGFSIDERLLLSQLVRYQRRTVRREFVTGVGKRKRNRHLLLMLRVAVTLHRGRGAYRIPRPEVLATEGALELRFPGGWLADHPLTEGDLAAEAAAVDTLGLGLTFA